MNVYGKDGNKHVERGKVEIPPGADITHRSSIEWRRSVVLEHPKASAIAAVLAESADFSNAACCE